MPMSPNIEPKQPVTRDSDLPSLLEFKVKKKKKAKKLVKAET